MTIRKTLLLGFLLVGLAPAILLAGLAFVKARQALQAEIESSLVAQASAVASDIDSMIFERLQNAATWRQLEVMQDIQVNDVDKRLSSFLAKLKLGYAGVYRDLYVTDRNGRIVASSDAGALGRTLGAPVRWYSVDLAGVRVDLDMPQARPEGASLMIRTRIPSQFSSQDLGELVLRFDWSQIGTMLDRVAGSGRMLALIDADGRMVSASRGLRERGLLSGRSLADWAVPPDGRGAFVRGGEPLMAADLIVGVGHAPGFANFRGFGWKTLIIQPLDQALEPVRRMALIFLALLGALILVTVAMSAWVSRAIARPVVALTAFTRRYMRDKALSSPPPATGGEVGELTSAFVRMMRDIEQSRQHLVRASKLAVVGEMSSIIAHEIRTPMGILRSSAQMLLREPGLSEEGRELMGFIESETARLNKLVSSMLDSARPRAPRPAATDVHELIRQSLALLAAQAEKSQVRLEARLAAADPVVECDAEQITQVMLNLVLNGLQILGQGGQVLVSTCDEPAHLCIEIADDGPGIAPEERSRVFEAFFFQREGGVGLGLAIVQQIVCAHGGEIEATESELGGALFRIRLPRETERES